METFNNVLEEISTVIWHDWVLYITLLVGVLFTLWSGFCQYRALTHGVSVTRGKYDKPDDPGAINHFQALSAALSATVGLGNIGGVALAIALGGPGAVFWMWVIGLAGMALKTTEVTLSMLYRNTDDPDNPHGGPMWVAAKGLEKRGLGGLGKALGAIFCITLLISAITGGNMFQSWNVADITNTYFGIPQVATGIILAVVVGMVIIGGIKRIGSVAGKLVPFMCAIYLLAALYVIALNIGDIPGILAMIVKSAFNPHEATGAFLGGSAAFAFFHGMKRALFSSEAGQGSSPIAHSAAKTDEPVREAVVAGLEPFIDTIVVCTLTALVILSSGIWNRGADHALPDGTQVIAATGDDGNQLSQGDGADLELGWTLPEVSITDAQAPSGVYAVVTAHMSEKVGSDRYQMQGEVAPVGTDAAAPRTVTWKTVYAPQGTDVAIAADASGIFYSYDGATMTAKAFDATTLGLGKWLVTLAAWLFAISTMISWSYYGEQGMVFLFGDKSVLPYKFVYCLLIVVAALPFLITGVTELDNLTTLGTGVMLWANIPIMLIFGALAMRAYHEYGRKLKAGEFKAHDAPSITDVVEGRDHD